MIVIITLILTLVLILGLILIGLREAVGELQVAAHLRGAVYGARDLLPSLMRGSYYNFLKSDFKTNLDLKNNP